jgi:hypothetical protein
LPFSQRPIVACSASRWLRDGNLPVIVEKDFWVCWVLGIHAPSGVAELKVKGAGNPG